MKKLKIKNFLENNRKAVIATVGVCSTMLPTIAHAADSTIASTITSSFQQIVTDTLASIAAIAPIGITIFGAMFAWKKGKQFFSTVTSK